MKKVPVADDQCGCFGQLVRGQSGCFGQDSCLCSQ